MLRGQAEGFLPLVFVVGFAFALDLGLQFLVRFATASRFTRGRIGGGLPMSLAVSIRTDHIAAERARVARELGVDPKQADPQLMLPRNILRVEDKPDEPLQAGQTRLRNYAVSIEHNPIHAAIEDTGGIAHAHGGVMWPGNAAVGEIIEVASDVTSVKVGDIVMTHCNGEPGNYGFPNRIMGYDQLGVPGWYGQQPVIDAWRLLHVPENTGLTVEEIAALTLRGPTAGHLYRRAVAVHAAVLGAAKGRLKVFSAGGGGTAELFLQLAKIDGHNAAMCAGNATRRQALKDQFGIESIDRGAFDLAAKDKQVLKDNRGRYQKAINTLTGGEKFDVVLDMFRGGMLEYGIQAMAMGAVNVSAGWQLSRELTLQAAMVSARQWTFTGTHYETIEGCAEIAKRYGRGPDKIRPILDPRRLSGVEAIVEATDLLQANKADGTLVVRLTDELSPRARQLFAPSAT